MVLRCSGLGSRLVMVLAACALGLAWTWLWLTSYGLVFQAIGRLPRG